MEVVNERSSLKTYSGIEHEQCMKNVLVDVKLERESDDETESEIDLLYADHVIKEEMVIGPEVLHKAIYNSDRSKDVPPLNKPRLDENTNQKHPREEATEIGTLEITVSDADKFLHKNPRLKKRKKRTYRQDTHNGIKEKFASNVDSNKSADNIKRLNKKIKQSNENKTHRKDQGKYKNCGPVKSHIIRFICDNCGRNFKRKRELIQHIESHEKIKRKIYLKCKECTYQTVARDSLKRHKKLHDKSRLYVCDACGYRFKKNDALRSHLKNVHLVKKIRKCDICDYRTKHLGHFNKHLRIHFDEKRYCCSLCDYKCTVKRNLTNHLKVHFCLKIYTCDECEKKFANKSVLKRHRNVHTGEKRYSCTKCEKFFCDKWVMLRHARTVHTGQKPFACSVCEYRCAVKNNLIKHMRIHTGEKPFKCSVCQFKCSQEGTLKNHIRIHTGIKPFSCSICQYKCIKKSNLTSHLNRVHNK